MLRIVANMGTNAVQRGPTADTVSENVKRLRVKQNLGLRGLSQKLAEVGRPLGHSAVDQIEKGTRRVDVDDLLGLAAALGVSPSTLLMPVAATGDDTVSATAVGERSAEQLWAWIIAEEDLGLDRPVRSRPKWEPEPTVFAQGNLDAMIAAVHAAVEKHGSVGAARKASRVRRGND